METREKFQNRLKVELGAFGHKVDALKQKAQEAESTVQSRFKPYMEELTTKLHQAKERVTEIAGSTDDAWEKLREGAQKSWDDLKVAFEAAAHAFEEHGKRAGGTDHKKSDTHAHTKN